MVVPLLFAHMPPFHLRPYLLGFSDFSPYMGKCFLFPWQRGANRHRMPSDPREYRYDVCLFAHVTLDYRTFVSSKVRTCTHVRTYVCKLLCTDGCLYCTQLCLVFLHFECVRHACYACPCFVLCMQRLRMKAKSEAGPMSVARLPINMGRNRYRDVLPGMGGKRRRRRE